VIHYKEYRDSVLKVIREADMPLGIETIRKKTGIRVWETAKAILLELVVEGKIAGMKTGKSWVFGRPETMRIVMTRNVANNPEEVKSK